MTRIFKNICSLLVLTQSIVVASIYWHKHGVSTDITNSDYLKVRSVRSPVASNN